MGCPLDWTGGPLYNLDLVLGVHSGPGVDQGVLVTLGAVNRMASDRYGGVDGMGGMVLVLGGWGVDVV